MQITACLDCCAALYVDLLKKGDLHLQFARTKTKRHHPLIVIIAPVLSSDWHFSVNLPPFIAHKWSLTTISWDNFSFCHPRAPVTPHSPLTPTHFRHLCLFHTLWDFLRLFESIDRLSSHPPHRFVNYLPQQAALDTKEGLFDSNGDQNEPIAGIKLLTFL